MNPFALYSEPYGSTGNIGENFRRLLGAPALDPLQTVIREAVQNIADAAKLGQGPEILIRLRTLTPQQQKFLSEVALHQLPQEDSSQELLQETLRRKNLVVLEICDFGTTGLGGPTRADRLPVGTERTDFIDFLRNIGTPRDTDHGGGTYGFGKVALYRASRCSTILVDSLPHEGGTGNRRLIACHVGKSFGVPDHGMLRRFTGRHWWGLADPADGVVDPITGSFAEEMSAMLGFPQRGEHRTGTSIMILDFETEDEDLSSAGLRIAETMLWNFWPRMMRDVPENRRFNCTVEVEGRCVSVPEPESIAPFDLFCTAMQAARLRSGADVRNIESQRPAKFLGTLAIEKGLRSQRRLIVESGALTPAVAHHIALMRPVELVVKYLVGSPFPNEKIEWAGVFLASSEDDVEQAFASSEPPAHDDWIPDNLPRGNSKIYVNVALRKLKGIAAGMGIIPLPPPPPLGSGASLARVAGQLGKILEEAGGDGEGRSSLKGSKGTDRPIRAGASRPVFNRLELGKPGCIAVFTTEVTQDKAKSGAMLSASVSIAIEGSGASKIDEAIAKPTVLSIRSIDGSIKADGPQLPLSGKEGEFELRVIMPDDCAVIVDAEILPEL